MGEMNVGWVEKLRYDGTYVNGVHHSSSHLANETAQLALRSLEWISYTEAMRYIHLPQRQYSQRDRNGTIWLVFRNQHWVEKDIEVLGYGASTENTLEREIVATIKWQNDAIFPEVDAVKTLRDIIIRIASNPAMRQKLHLLRSDLPPIVNGLGFIDEKRKKWKMSEVSLNWRAAVEKRSEKFFWDFMELADCSEEDLGAIHWLSWAWKLPETYGKLKHMAWCWVLITCVFGLIK